MIQGFELLGFNHAGAMTLKNGQTINYGVIRKDHEKLVYFTGMGLREMWKPDSNEQEKKRAAELYKIYTEPGGEQKLIASGHIAITFFKDIETVNF